MLLFLSVQKFGYLENDQTQRKYFFLVVAGSSPASPQTKDFAP